MANTTAERQKFKQALTLIANKYHDCIAGNANMTTLLGADTGRFDAMVKFMDSRPFMANLTLSGKAPVGCTVNGFTDFLTNPPSIYVNRNSATSSTLIHELLHFLTHDNFSKSLPVAVVEGATEYFTRKVQNIADPTTHADFKNVRTSYDKELSEIRAARSLLKGVLAPMMPVVRSQPIGLGRHRDPGFMPDPLAGLPIIKGFMKKAYFGGDAQSIALFKKILAAG